MRMTTKGRRGNSCPWVQLTSENLEFMSRVVEAEFASKVVHCERKRKKMDEDESVEAGEHVLCDEDEADKVEHELCDEDEAEGMEHEGVRREEEVEDDESEEIATDSFDGATWEVDEDECS